MNYYEQTYPLDPATPGRILFITNQKRVKCDDIVLPPLAPFDTAGGAYDGKNLRAYLLLPDCFEAMR